MNRLGEELALKRGKKVLSVALALGIAVPALSPSMASAAGAPVKSVKFNGMAAPNTVEEMAKPYSEATVDVTYADGSKKTFPLTWKELFKSGDELAEIDGQKFPASTPLDVNGKPIKFDSDGNGKEDYYVSNAPDGNTFLEVDGKYFMVSHFESHANGSYSVPDSMTLTELKQNSDGTLDVVSVSPIDFSEVNGIWIPCNASTSPWNTHLGSEEYEPDARAFVDDQKSSSYKDVTDFAQLYFGDKAKANPYFYGWTPEITVHADGSTKVEKHYSMGRFSKELGQVLGDEKTVIFGDDGSDVAIFMYVADRKADLSSGTLYAAKFDQTSGTNGGAGKLTWISLGHATDNEIKQIIDSGVTFHDIFDVSDEAKEGYKPVRVAGKMEYLKLKPGKEKAAAFLESRRYAQYLGATAEFRKMEGVAFNQNADKAYIAMAEINKSMLAEPDQKIVSDDIRFDREDAGAVYEMNLASGQKDTAGNVIKSTEVPVDFSAIIVGETMEKPDALGNHHNPDKISNPDNLNFSPAMNTLFVGEDSGADEGHVNNFVWAYHPDTKALERILSVPAGAEATGLLPVDDVNGAAYVMSSFQHPGSGVKDAPITAVNKDELVKAIADGPYGIKKNAGLGYLHGLSLAAKKDAVKFSDVKEGHWAYPVITDLAEKGIIKGKSAQVFDPNGIVTRGQFAAFLTRALDLKATKPAPFKDATGMFADDIAAAYEAGITSGVSKDKFEPNKPITREQMAAMIIRAYKVKTGKSYEASKQHAYQDRKHISGTFLKDVDAAYELGFMSGYGNGQFGPKQTATRAQAAKVIYSLLQK